MAISTIRVETPTSNGPKVLVVDDEPEVREILSSYLDRNGYCVSEAVSGSEALYLLKSEEPDLMILDVSLPGVDGLSVLTELRRHSDLPVILLSGRAEESDRILGLELGADDYVTKPFSPRELVARVRNLLKRLHPLDYQGGVDRQDFGDLIVDRRTREVWVAGQLVDLTRMEFDLLEYFSLSPRQVFSKEQLLDQVWNSSPDWQDPATVTVHVRRLRKKIEISPANPRWIVTVWGVGYRFEPEAPSS